MSLSEILKKTATDHPNNEAVVYKSHRLTYGDLYHKARQLSARLIKRGVQPGDRIVLLFENCPAYLISYFGVLGSGAVVVALNPDTTSHELKYLISDSNPKAIICHASVLPILEPCIAGSSSLEFILVEGCLLSDGPNRDERIESLADTLEEDLAPELSPVQSDSGLAQIIYTSGTTGKPKGVMLTQRSLIENSKSIVRYLKLTNRDRVLAILPFFYSYGNSILLTHAFVGGTLVIADQFVFLNKIVSQMIQEGVTGFSGVPSSYAMLLRQSAFPKTRFEHLRYVTCAGGALSRSVILELRNCLPDTEIYIMYGQTEASARLSYLDPAELQRKIGSIGKGMPGVVLRVLKDDGTEVVPGEIGEIVAEGECLMAGYWNNPMETHKALKDGRLFTGDLATIDEEGFIYIAGRQSDIIKCGSYRIHPFEIEEVLQSHPDVLESAVVGVEDAVLGESIAAFIVVDNGSHLSASEILRFARHFLPNYKLPRKVAFVEALPKTSSGKIKRRALKNQAGNFQHETCDARYQNS